MIFMQILSFNDFYANNKFYFILFSIVFKKVNDVSNQCSMPMVILYLFYGFISMIILFAVWMNDDER